MDLNKDKVTALVFAHLVWIIAASIPYFATPGTTLNSFSAAAFIVGGMLVAGPLFGLGFHGLRTVLGNALAPAGGPDSGSNRTVPLMGVLLVIVEVIAIVIAAQWIFGRVETARAGFPIEWAGDRQGFNAAIAILANANKLQQEVKAAREAGQPDTEKEAQVAVLVEQGLRFGRGVGDPFLAYLDPELPERYHTQLVRGFEMILQGSRTSDLETTTAGDTLVRQFYLEYMPSRVDTILRRMGSEAAPPAPP